MLMQFPCPAAQSTAAVAAGWATAYAALVEAVPFAPPDVVAFDDAFAEHPDAFPDPLDGPLDPLSDPSPERGRHEFG